MEESKLQAIADSLSKHSGRKGLGTSSTEYSWSKVAIPPLGSARTDGLPTNALYSNFVKGGSYDPTKKTPLNHGNGRIIKRDFSDTPETAVDNASTDAASKVSKEARKAAKKAAKQEAKKQVKLEEKRRLKKASKHETKEKAKFSNQTEEVHSSKSRKRNGDSFDKLKREESAGHDADGEGWQKYRSKKPKTSNADTGDKSDAERGKKERNDERNVRQSGFQGNSVKKSAEKSKRGKKL